MKYGEVSLIGIVKCCVRCSDLVSSLQWWVRIISGIYKKRMG